MSADYIRVVDFQPGDRYGLGMAYDPPFIVERVQYARGAEIGSEVERQRYQIVATDGRLSPWYMGDSKAYRLERAS